ncbi:MAG: HEPN domain-containing protein [Caldilineaceae bacterium]|nr:HEPN domain-containing protein [Caldilineaceae bacterium]HRJ43175.1 HEPN domain-containing protein [Caldilineaceae bacterium]
MNAETQRWLNFAQVAKYALTDEIFNQVCFHSQQAVEKSLKAYLMQRDNTTPRTHSIADLLRLLSLSWLGDTGRVLYKMDNYYIPTRYPDAPPGSLPDGMAGRDDAREALSLAEETYRLTLLALAQYDNDEPNDR